MTAAQQRLRILMVDDDEADRVAIIRLLAREPVDLSVATSAADAREALREQRFDCVLLDGVLPDVHAREFVSELVRSSPSMAIVALTGVGDDAIAVELMKAGARDYLTKGTLDAARLKSSIHAAVALTRARALQFEVAELRRRHHHRLEHLVARAHELVGSLSPQVLADRAVAICAQMLDAMAVTARFVDADGDYSASFGAPMTTALSTVESLPSAAGEAGRIMRLATVEGQVLSMWLSPPNDLGERSMLTALVTAHDDAAEMGLVEALFTQLGVLLARSLENHRLMRSVERAVRARDDVMAVVSHDLRGPLANSLMACGLLEDNVDAEGKLILGRMQHSLQHMQHLVDDLVQVVRAQQGDVPLDVRVVDAGTVIEQARAIVTEAAQRANVTVTTTAPSPTMLRADHHRLLQVLANLIGNAVKFTPPGGHVQVSVQDDGDDVLFHVADDGAGIAAADQARIFDRFYSADRQGRGLGLGLAIAKGVVRAHGGRIGVRSPGLGQGSTFFFTLPRRGPPTASST